MKLTHGSLFSGIGGFDLAAEWAGFENIFHCEWNPFGRQVLEYHFPNSDSYGDITKTNFAKYRGQITVLSGGFPCQPFSHAGKRGGAEDDRYLWPEMLRAIKEIHPLWVIGENVTGITSMVQPSKTFRMESQASLFEEDTQDIEVSEYEFVIETICQDLESIGYSVQPIVIPACAVGAPHRRDRVWFIANSGSERLEGRVNSHRSQPTVQLCASRLYTWKSAGDGQVADWALFPTQPPIYPRNDGVSCQLGGCSFSGSKWREEAVKASGNAIVPQVAYEILEGIKDIELETNKQ